MPTGRKPLDDSLAMEEWQRLRNLQIAGGDEGGSFAPAALADDLSMQDWRRIRDHQADGAFLGARPMHVAVVAAAQPRKPLTGRPGTAAVVAGALNTIVSGPNTSAPVRAKGVDGVVRRGAGRDVSAEGKVWMPGIPRLPGLPAPRLRAEGALEPPTGRAEVVISKVRGRGAVELPDRVRFFNTPGGELDVELPSDGRIGPVPIAKGVYVIGKPDPPRRK